MPEQFRRVRKGHRSKTFRLAEAVREAKTEVDRDQAVANLITDVQQAVLRIASAGIAGDSTLDRIRRRAELDPTYAPSIDECARIVLAAAVYAEVNDLDSRTLQDRLIGMSGDDMPDSLDDPDDL